MASGFPARAIDGGVTLTVRVIPRARHSQLAGIRADALLVRLSAPPVDGAANDALVRLLADAFGVPARAVAIASGERGRLKTVRISGITLADLASRLALTARPDDSAT